MSYRRLLTVGSNLMAGCAACILLGCSSSSDVTTSSTAIPPVTVASVSVSVTNGNAVIPGGVATTVPVIVTAKDASGNTITGLTPYANPITLSNSDATGVTTLSTTTLTSPATDVTLSYNPTNANGGTLPSGIATVGATAAGVSASAVTPGTFQYIADRFFGFGHSRTLTGTASWVATGIGSPTGVSWNVSNVISDTTGATFNGQFGLIDVNSVLTYTQISPAGAAGPEVVTQDDYRNYTLTSSGANLYEMGINTVDVVPGTAPSRATGDVAGTTTLVTTYTAPLPLIDMLPQGSNTWTNTGVRTQTATGAQVSTFTQNIDASTFFAETTPFVVSQVVSAGGVSSSSVNGTLSTVGAPTPAGCTSGCTLPVTVTTPNPGSITTAFSALDWYPGGAQPLFPLSQFVTTQTSAVPIPAQCNIPATVTAAIGTTATQVTSTQTLLRIPQAQYRTRTQSDFYVHGGVGLVCQIISETNQNYQVTTGVLLNSTVFTYAAAIQSTAALSSLRGH